MLINFSNLDKSSVDKLDKIFFKEPMNSTSQSQMSASCNLDSVQNMQELLRKKLYSNSSLKCRGSLS